MTEQKKNIFRMHFEMGDLIKIPNILCYLRIALVPLFCYIYLNAETNMITDLGKVLDPLADKLMQFAMLVCVTVRVHYMATLVAVLIIKEIVMALIAAVVIKTCNKRLNGAKWYGKVCTFVILIMMPDMPLPTQTILFAACFISLAVSFAMYIRIYTIMILDTKKYGNKEFKAY